MLERYGSLQAAANALCAAADASIPSEVRKRVEQLRSGGDGQKEWAAWALANLAGNADNQVAIARAGGIAPLVALARGGTEDEKYSAAAALQNLARNAENQMAIAKAGGIAPLVALARDGTDDQTRWASGALAWLDDNADNHVAIKNAGWAFERLNLHAPSKSLPHRNDRQAAANALRAAADASIPSHVREWVEQLRSGGGGQKEQAARELRLLAESADNQVAIAKAGGIAPLVALARNGTDAQKEKAAGALGNLARNADNQVAIAKAGGIAPLVALARNGTGGQKRWAVGALANLQVQPRSQC